MLSVSEALQLVVEKTQAGATEECPLESANGRILRETIVSSHAIPLFDNSAMDGYAVRVADVASASGDHPVRLRVVDVVGAGQVSEKTLGLGEAIQIMTGAPLPNGTEAVLMVEKTRKISDESVEVHASVRVGENCRRSGEDVAVGTELFAPGHRLRPLDLGLLASVGRARVRVAVRPSVAILATGNELLPSDQPLEPGKLWVSTPHVLRALVEEAGGVATDFGIIADDPDVTRLALTQALKHDVILTTGGVSAGEFDYVQEAMKAAGVQIHFWKIRQRPGKPLVFGTLGSRLVFGLPGNPVSSIVCYYLYVRPALEKILGVHSSVPIVVAELESAVRQKEDLTQFIRVRLYRRGPRWEACPDAKQSSGVLSSLSRTDGIAEIPEGNDELPAGTPISVMVIHPEQVLQQV